jgi:leucyl/phenylalanyl-tRNA--protein transferase
MATSAPAMRTFDAGQTIAVDLWDGRREWLRVQPRIRLLGARSTTDGTSVIGVTVTPTPAELFEIRLDTAFRNVMAACAKTPRRHEGGTWISPRFIDAYTELHQWGLAHSAEAWRGDDLVGGLYGVSLGAIFFGESMFARAPDASKIAFVALVAQLLRWKITLVDCQVYTDHLARFGASEWPRRRFLAALEKALDRPTRPGPWSFDATG